MITAYTLLKLRCKKMENTSSKIISTHCIICRRGSRNRDCPNDERKLIRLTITSPGQNILVLLHQNKFLYDRNGHLNIDLLENLWLNLINFFSSFGQSGFCSLKNPFNPLHCGRKRRREQKT